jgi:hypothetical protein
VVRRARLRVVVGAFLIGCAVLLVVGCAEVRPEATQEDEQGRAEATEEQGRSPEATASEEDRCGRTRTVPLGGDDAALTNDLPGCPDGGVLSGTNEADKLSGGGGDDEVRGLGGADELWGGFGRDVMHGGAGDDFLTGSTVNEDGHDQGDDVLRGGPGSDSLNGFGGDDVIYGGDGDDVERLWGGRGEDVLRGGDGDDFLDGTFDGGDRDELYCGEGRDDYAADKNDYVSGDCEVKAQMGRM